MMFFNDPSLYSVSWPGRETFQTPVPPWGMMPWQGGSMQSQPFQPFQNFATLPPTQKMVPPAFGMTWPYFNYNHSLPMQNFPYYPVQNTPVQNWPIQNYPLPFQSSYNSFFPTAINPYQQILPFPGYRTF